MFTTPLREEFNPFKGSLDLIPQDPAQIVTVATSGAMFTSIQDAINSITDAASNKQYVIHIAPGVYTGNLTLKPFVHLVGEGNGPAAPLVVGKITAIDYPANQYTLINRLGQSYTVASDGETCNNWYSPVIVNDFFATFSTDKNYSFLGIYQSCANLSSVSTVMVNCQILCSSTYDGSTKDIVALHQTGDGFGAGVSSMTVQISSKNSSGELACRRISVSGAAEYNSALCNMKISNVKAASTATACATIVSSASTGYRISANDQVRISGNLASASAQCMNTSGNAGKFFAVGASVYIDPAITGYAANTAVGDTQYVWLNSTSANYPTTGAGLAIVTPYTLIQSGFVDWSSVGATYWSYNAGTRAFTLSKRFTGLVKSSPVVAPAAQTLSGGSALTNFAANYLYVDSTGALKSTLTKNEALFEDNIPFGILYSDGTNYLFKKENHPAKFPTAVSGYLHETSGNLLANNGGGNLTTLVAASRTIKMVGASTLKDHGLNTTLPDSSGAALSFTSVYTGASGTTIDGTGLTAIPSKWQNTTTTVTNALNNERIVVRIGVLMDNFNSSAPQYVFVYHNAVYGNSTAAQNAINGGNITAFPQALIDLEVIQLGFACVTANGSGGGTLDTAVGTNGIVISKQVANANLLSGAASNVAGNIINDVTNFGVILSSADTSAQLAFDTIDNTAAKKATSSVDNAIVRFDGTGGQLLQSNYTLNKEPIITDAGIIQVNNDTDATSTTDGSLQTDGGLSVVKAGFFGGKVTSVALDATTGRITTDNATEATSTTDGSIQTDGGLSVAKKIYCGTSGTFVTSVITDTISERTAAAGVTIDSVLLKDNEVTANKAITDAVQTKTAAGTFNFNNQGGTSRGSYTDAGVWKFSALNVYAAAAAGGIYTAYDSTYAPVSLNYRRSNTDPYLGFNTVQVASSDNQNYATSDSASRIWHDLGSDLFKIDVAAAGTAGNAITWVQAANCTSAGAWTLGPSGGTGAAHTIITGNSWIRTDESTAANRSGANFVLNSGSSGRYVQFILDPNGANSTGSDYFSLRANQAGDVAINNYGVESATISNAGAWTLGPSTALQAHLVNGNLSIYFKSSTTTDDICNIYSDVGGTKVEKWRVEADGDTISATGSYTSDERAKKNIAPIHYGLNQILQLSPKSFHWWHEDDAEVKSFCVSTAQEVQAIMPEIVREDGLDGPNGEKMKAVYEKEIVAVLVKAVQEQQNIIDTQASRIQQLESLVAAQADNIASVLARLEALEGR